MSSGGSALYLFETDYNFVDEIAAATFRQEVSALSRKTNVTLREI